MGYDGDAHKSRKRERAENKTEGVQPPTLNANVTDH